MKSFFLHLENIGKDIGKGIAIAAPIVGTIVPAVGPILAEVATVITALEQKGQTIDPATLSIIVQAIATSEASKQVSTPAPTFGSAARVAAEAVR